MPSDAVVVRAPEHAPRRIAGWKRNRYLPAYIARIKGTVVTAMPHRKQAQAELLKAGDEARAGRNTDHRNKDVQADPNS
jgi:hypothetical protein